MQKIFINKESNRVEQILKVETMSEVADDYFNNCYAIIDKEEKINAYNLRYDKETEEFKVIEGIPERDEVIIVEKNENDEIEKLKNENEELKSRLEKIEELLNEK